MSYRDQMDLAQDHIFIQRVKNAMINSATTIFNESGGTANHIQRAAFARSVMNAPDQYAPIIAVAVAADAINFPATITRDGAGNVTSATTTGIDAGIDGRVNNVWNSYCVS